MVYRQADEIRLWANIVGHDDIVPEKIAKDDVEQLLTYLGALLDAVYVQPTRLGKLTEKRKQLTKSDT